MRARLGLTCCRPCPRSVGLDLALQSLGRFPGSPSRIDLPVARNAQVGPAGAWRAFQQKQTARKISPAESRHGAQPAPPTSLRTQLEFGRRPRALPFGPLSKALIGLSDPQHRHFSLRIIHLIRKNPRFFCDFLPAAAWRPRDTEQSPHPADHRLGGSNGSDEPVWRADMAKRLNCTIAVALAKLSVAEKVRMSLVPGQMF